jgi:hypothetical protein
MERFMGRNPGLIECSLKNKEIASFLAMTTKVRRHLLPPTKERELIRHCEKTLEREHYYFVRS